MSPRHGVSLGRRPDTTPGKYVSPPAIKAPTTKRRAGTGHPTGTRPGNGCFQKSKLSLNFAFSPSASVPHPKMIRTFGKNDWKNNLIGGFETLEFCFIVTPESMTVSQIAGLLEISKSISTAWSKLILIEVPKSRQDLQQWADFVNRHRIEPIGGRMPSAPRAPRA